MKKHRIHVQKVLTKLREAGIQADVDKCEFHVTGNKISRPDNQYQGYQDGWPAQHTHEKGCEIHIDQ